VPDAADTAGPPWPRPEIPHQLNPVHPVFFVSHATAYDPELDVRGTEPNALFSEFYRDLSQDLNQLVARRAGADPGFIDRGLRAGAGWEPEILNAIGTCQVLVALVSGPFAGSEWCGKEWYAFTSRRTWRRSDNTLMDRPFCALPVLWTVGPQNDYPQIVMKQQQFKPRPSTTMQLDRIYLREGIYGMYMVEPAAYRASVWRLAQEIKKLVTEYWVEPLIPTDNRTLINVFAEEET